MSIEREYGYYTLYCDTCGDNQEVESFEDALDIVKNCGWKAKKINGDWEHICPDCLKESEV